MLLDIPCFVSGAAWVEAVGGRWRLHRLPADAEQWLSALAAPTAEIRTIRAACHAGIRLRWQGRCRRVVCDVIIEAACRSTAAVELLRDGQSVALVSASDVQVAQHCRWTLEPPESDAAHDFDLWLPHTAGGLWRVELDGDAAPLPTADLGGCLWAIGDSITQGMAASSPARTYTAWLARHCRLSLVNHGIGGHRFDAVLAARSLAGMPAEPSIVTIAYGTNDWTGHVPAGLIAERAGQLIEAVTTALPNATLLLVSPLWRVGHDEPRDGQTLRQAVGGLPALADGRRVRLIDGFSLMEHSEQALQDRVHPNDAGMLQVANGLIPHVRGALAAAHDNLSGNQPPSASPIEMAGGSAAHLSR